MVQDKTSKPGTGTRGRLPAWDKSAALAATGGDERLATELLEALLLSLPADISALRGLFDARDWARIDDVAHRMRGATAYCGAPALDTALEGLKNAARCSDERQIEGCLRQVELEAERLRAEF
jgi:two-component system sensor histidine kinase BarA